MCWLSISHVRAVSYFSKPFYLGVTNETPLVVPTNQEIVNKCRKGELNDQSAVRRSPEPQCGQYTVKPHLELSIPESWFKVSGLSTYYGCPVRLLYIMGPNFGVTAAALAQILSAARRGGRATNERHKAMRE
jgi:hypothetical protein